MLYNKTGVTPSQIAAACSTKKRGAMPQIMTFSVKNPTDKKQAVVMFDATGAISDKTGIVTGEGVSIMAQGFDYQDLVRNIYAGDKICFGGYRATVTAGKEAQFDNIVKVYSNNKYASDTRIENEYTPSAYITPEQNQANIVNVNQAFTLDNTTAFVTDIEAGATLTLHFFPAAMKDNNA